MQTLVHEMRGIPLWLLREYLQELGGTAIDDNLVKAEGWRVRLTRMEPFRLDIEIEDQLADAFLKAFAKKTLRAGA